VSTSRYGRLRYGIGRYGGYGPEAAPVLPARQPATLGQPGARPLLATSGLRQSVLAGPGGTPLAVTPDTRGLVLPRPGSRPSDPEPG
jgi:hypothetical protein